MKTVAIITEYNPFHTGHKYQIEKIRDSFGADTRIIAIMSGNYTQRGDVAFADKNLRARTAVDAGVNLVLELPFPYSISSAEFFARAGVHIADSLGVVDYLSFGSESGNIDTLVRVAENMLDPSFEAARAEILKDNSKKSIGYPKASEEAYRKVFKEEIPGDFFSPNNILAVEYIKAIKLSNSKIKPHTITRFGAHYSAESIEKVEHQSATAIRELMQDNFVSALNYLPEVTRNALFDAYNSGELPCDGEKLSAAIISHLRLNSSTAFSEIHDAGGGLYNRLQSASFEAKNISSLIELADTKKYTTARIRRAIWYSFLGVTSSEFQTLPLFTQALAMDSVGKFILKDVKKMSRFPVITKPAAYQFLSAEAKLQKEKCERADSVFQLTKPTHVSGSSSLKCTPYIKK